MNVVNYDRRKPDICPVWRVWSRIDNRQLEDSWKPHSPCSCALQYVAYSAPFALLEEKTGINNFLLTDGESIHFQPSGQCPPSRSHLASKRICIRLLRQPPKTDKGPTMNPPDQVTSVDNEEEAKETTSKASHPEHEQLLRNSDEKSANEDQVDTSFEDEAEPERDGDLTGLMVEGSGGALDLCGVDRVTGDDIQTKKKVGDAGTAVTDKIISGTSKDGDDDDEEEEEDEIVTDSAGLSGFRCPRGRGLLYPSLLFLIVVFVAVIVTGVKQNDDQQQKSVPSDLGDGAPSVSMPPSMPPTYAGCPGSLGPLEIGSYLYDQNTTDAPSVDLMEYSSNYSDSDCALSLEAAASNGLWYTVIGTGDWLMVTTCADFDLRITVLDGTDCGKSNGCVAHSQLIRSSTCFDGLGLQWESDLGLVYYVVVHGGESDWSDKGSFDLRFGNVAENDLCEGAPSLSLNTAIEGDTSFSSPIGDSYDEEPPYPAAETCLQTGVTDDDNYKNSHEVWSVQKAGGVWYQFELDTDQPVRATTSCTGDEDEGYMGTHIVVFAGSCVTLHCVGTSIDIKEKHPDLYCAENSVSWLAKAGQTYLIHVHGVGYDDFNVGKFSLVVTEESSDAVQTLAPKPDTPNEICTDAIGPLEIGKSVRGSTAGALNGKAPECGGATAQIGSGVWYLVRGTGQEMIVSTCPPSGDHWLENDFSKQVSLFEGSCGDLICIDGGSYVSGFDNSVCYGSAGVSWDSVEGQDYYILVHGEYLGSSGNFDLYLDVVHPNHHCEAATPLALATEVEGSTFYGVGQSTISCGEASEQSSNGVWYTFVNEESVAKPVIATTCTLGEASSENVQISVFSGSDCDSLFCVDGSNSTDPEGKCFIKEAGVAWLAEPNVVYRILVHHQEWDDGGSFTLEVRETELSVDPLPFTPKNDLCTSAVELPREGYFLNGTTAGADYDRDVNEDAESPGVWYYFVGSGNTKFLTVVKVGDEPRFTFDLYRAGSDLCDDLEKIDWFDGFQTEQGVVYYVLVYSWDNMKVGDFQIRVFEK
eukprot:scaffold2533_cov137-Cylindrotheca_fusiformis.AAC.9